MSLYTSYGTHKRVEPLKNQCAIFGLGLSEKTQKLANYPIPKSTCFGIRTLDLLQPALVSYRYATTADTVYGFRLV